MIIKTEDDAYLGMQQNEITEHIIYAKLSSAIKNKNNKKILREISADELKHYNFWKKITKKDVEPNRLKIWKYVMLSKIFGVTFGIKLMEKGEKGAQITYSNFSKTKEMIKDESGHEEHLIKMIDEERMQYMGSVVLGLNDALVELTGALAGFTLALQNSKLIALTGLISGVAASLSMATSEYMSTASEASKKSPKKAAIYTGFAYLLAVLFLIFPFLITKHIYFALGMTIINAIIVIFLFTFYLSVTRELPFKKRFLQTILISLGVAAISFGVGFLIRILFGIQL